MSKIFLFDIDHTLYPHTNKAETEITNLIDLYLTESMGLSLDEAQIKRDHYYQLFGTTLAGLLYYDQINAQDYIAYKDRFRLDILDRDEAGLAKLRNAERRMIAITNSHRNHGKRVLKHLDIDHKFESVHGIEDMGFWGKPFRKSFDMVFETAQIDPSQAVFFEDTARNLAYPKQLGMTTILINAHSVKMGEAPDYVDHHVTTLNEAVEYALAL